MGMWNTCDALRMLGSSQLKAPQQYARMRRLYHHSLASTRCRTKGVNIVWGSVSLDWEVQLGETHTIGGGERCLPVGYSFDALHALRDVWWWCCSVSKANVLPSFERCHSMQHTQALKAKMMIIMLCGSVAVDHSQIFTQLLSLESLHLQTSVKIGRHQTGWICISPLMA